MARTSNKREEILQFLTKFVGENGYAPSVREICKAVGLQSTATVHYHLNALRDAGLISMDEMKKRAISLPESRRADRIPVVGVVTAGLPVLAVENMIMADRVLVMSRSPGSIVGEFVVPPSWPRASRRRYSTEFAEFCGAVSSCLEQHS